MANWSFNADNNATHYCRLTRALGTIQMSPLDEIELLIESSQFLAVYNALASELERTPSSKELLNISRLLSGKIRSKCMGLACNKATDGSREAMELEALLQKTVKLNGEGIYG